jgi:hypothetical protein
MLTASDAAVHERVFVQVTGEPRAALCRRRFRVIINVYCRVVSILASFDSSAQPALVRSCPDSLFSNSERK